MSKSSRELEPILVGWKKCRGQILWLKSSHGKSCGRP